MALETFWGRRGFSLYESLIHRVCHCWSYLFTFWYIYSEIVVFFELNFQELVSAFAGILADKYGIRKTAFIGGFIATLGLIISSFVVEQVLFKRWKAVKLWKSQKSNLQIVWGSLFFIWNIVRMWICLSLYSIFSNSWSLFWYKDWSGKILLNISNENCEFWWVKLGEWTCHCWKFFVYYCNATCFDSSFVNIRGNYPLNIFYEFSI